MDIAGLALSLAPEGQVSRFVGMLYLFPPVFVSLYIHSRDLYPESVYLVPRVLIKSSSSIRLPMQNFGERAFSSPSQ